MTDITCDTIAEALHTLDNFLGFVEYAKNCTTEEDYLRKYGNDAWTRDAWKISQDTSLLTHYRDVINGLLAR